LEKVVAGDLLDSDATIELHLAAQLLPPAAFTMERKLAIINHRQPNDAIK
jgi:hypothetical protein